MKDKGKLAIIIPIISAVISFFMLLFGNNIYDRIFKNETDIIFQTSKTNQFIPDDLLSVTNKYLTNKLNKPIADSLRIIKIKNLGSPSKKLRIQINLDGAIYDYKVESTEMITNNSIKNSSSIILNMERLSQDATIDLKVWFRDDSKNFSASYTDDISSKEINKETNYSYRNMIFLTIVAVIFLESLLFILNSIKRAKSEREEKDKKALLERFLKEIGESFMEDETSELADTEIEVQSSSEKDKVKERLRDLVKRNVQK
ncbi:hypothetical protein [Paenibacillus polymyxa]|uniref:hypothetical protein n=1 Tax=Paenibacillus polymyxa TaxID=1406 RepID=UPI0003D3A760|nr:hypothetical protein [Paenibacillus polymyxa]AIW41066.1 hypothetical protein X809_34335 [Paenibacillus polymyxa CR1]